MASAGKTAQKKNNPRERGDWRNSFPRGLLAREPTQTLVPDV